MPSSLRTVALLASALAASAVPAALAAEPAAQTGSLSVLSYNVAGLPEPLSGSEPAENSPLIGERLDPYDVVLLQEDWVDVLGQHGLRDEVGNDVPRTGYHDLIAAGANHTYESEPMGSPPPPEGTVARLSPDRDSGLPTGPTLTGDGLNVFSWLPIGPMTRVMWEECFGELHVSVLEEALAQSGAEDAIDGAGGSELNDEIDGGSADCGAQKGFSLTTLELAPGITVDLYDLHADAGGDPRDRAARARNFAQLAAFITSEERVGRPIILGGDTNLKTGPTGRAEDDAAWTTFLAETGLVDVCSVVECSEDPGAIDKVAFRSSGSLKLIPQSRGFVTDQFLRPRDNTHLSDHPPLLVAFHWISRPGPR